MEIHREHAEAAVTPEVVRHVAALASLELTAEEEVSLGRDLNAILGYVAELNELDTSGIAPMAQVSELLGLGSAASEGELRPELRPDEPRPSLDRALVMAAAPATDGTFFKVPKVIER
jgi:aspartyl-tRNA(Asn)/glutamyl-tRNA(Gln) amidotransferase subunit C